ncbi:MAG: NfeD family protein [Candidatus Rokubacteria bacterium]|nr:NfeD family protein [Candidatus Rokubacteria bacterium]
MTRSGLRRTLRELGSYILWQLPSWGVLALVLVWVTWAFDLQEWIAGALFALFVVKDLALFPAMRVVFHRSPFQPWPIGRRGKAIEPIRPEGYVRVDGELWRAQALRPEARIPAGSAVIVRDGRGLVLLVDQDGEPTTPAR